MTPPLLAALLFAAAPVRAEPPNVLADTAPVQSLVAMVMGDLGTPGLIVAPGTSPHDASLTPSEAQALTEADVIVWTGDALLPWLGESIASLAPQAEVHSLLSTDGWEPLPADGDDGIDPHAWLDPEVAAAWLGHIASALSQADPEDAETYRRNAAGAAERLATLGADLRQRPAPLGETGYAVGHDAYRYFGRAVGLAPAGAIAPSDGSEPAPSDIAALRDLVASGQVRCLLLDAETDPSWADTLAEGAPLSTATVDPEGLTLDPGPDLYPTLIANLTAALESCLGA
ncbi:Zinc ABC transporter, periplasmic-binding protein ZnuA [Rubellimicrobium mesophilum DSM 19309]|uniref:High-affinity zinc uptake system protein ZnuA n=1 Tax=Rubellimicrobium mesophilum DSM 19309 TaxID=442562 RepID=A0A017HT25_9RHOB|nr:zinc ABC transporter substrate-binding protein [Rubellimicrobium mesophilum]EYD77637.1 Zinc ABC transporter, periplasmic-binding protein ZnuA [Rubellimicrobium mesophilum DSM 19309]